MDVEGLQKSSLFVFGLGDAAKANFATFDGGQNDVGAVYAREQAQRPGGRAGRLRALEQMLSVTSSA